MIFNWILEYWLFVNICGAVSIWPWLNILLDTEFSTRTTTASVISVMSIETNRNITIETRIPVVRVESIEADYGIR